jgi:hypothetical protein
VTDRAALDEAVRRFPYRLKRWRVHGLTSAELHRLVPEIVAEYHRIVEQRRKER